MINKIKVFGFIVGAAFVAGTAVSVGIIFANTYVNQKKQEEEKKRLAEMEIKKQQEIVVQKEEELKKHLQEIEDLKQKIETLAEIAFSYEDHYQETSEAITGALDKIKEFVDMPMFTETKELSRKVNEIKKTIATLVELIESINKKLPKTKEEQEEQEEQNANGN